MSTYAARVTLNRSQPGGWLRQTLAIVGLLGFAGCQTADRSIELASPSAQTRPAPRATQRPAIPADLSYTTDLSRLPVLTNACIVVDPGHGGVDPGAWEHTLSRLPEKTIALDVAQGVADILRRRGARGARDPG